MTQAANDPAGGGLVLLGLGLLPLLILFVVWMICAIVAASIADHRGRSPIGFFMVTFFFLGPLGPGFALLAGREVDGVPLAPMEAVTKIRRVANGRQRFSCPRCGADNDVPDVDTSYDCWRCDEHRNVKPRTSTAK